MALTQMRVRAVSAGATTDVRVLLPHAMHSGVDRDAANRLVAAHFVQRILIKLNGRSLVDSEIGPGVSRNPVFTFRVAGGAKGDKVEVSWRDNKGESETVEAIVA
jgi:sulfur-oxidizing protein SoxZ